MNPRVGGSHGDLAQALALATWAHRGGYSTEAPGVGGEVDLALTFGPGYQRIHYGEPF